MKVLSPSLQKSPKHTIIRYSFQLLIQQIKISIKFPCKITLSCNYNEGILRGTKIVPLLNNIAKINQTITFNTSLKLNEEKDTYQQAKVNIEISLITQNGASLAGVVPIDLEDIIKGSTSRSMKEMYGIERCPDKQATAKIKVKFRCIGQKGYRVEGIMSPTRQDRLDHGSSSQSEITLNRERRNDSIKTTDLIKQQVSTWKNRVSEYESKFKSEKMENNKLNELLKGKEEIYLSLKSEIKRKQIQVQTVLKTLEEYKLQYVRVRNECQMVKKERDRFQIMAENIERLSQDRMNKLENEASGNIKKIERLLKQNQKLKRDQTTVSSVATGFKSNFQANNIGIINQLKRQNEQIQKQLRTQRQSYEKQLKQSKTLISNKQQSYNQILIKYESTSKKLQKLQQTRLQQLQKINYKMLQIQRSKQTFNTELHVLKKQRSRKDLGAQGHMKNIEKQLSEQSVNNMRLAHTITELQGEKIKLQKENEHSKGQIKIIEDEKNKFEKQVDHLKYQIKNLNQLLFVKNNQIKQANNLSKEYQQIYKKKQQSLEEEYSQKKSQFQIQLQQTKRSQQSKYISLTQILIKKQQQSQGISLKQQRLQLKINSLQDQIRKTQDKYKQKLQILKLNQQKLKHEYNQNFIKKAQSQKQFHQHIHHLQFQIQSLNQALMMAKQNQFKLLQRQQQNRLELEELKQMYSSVSIQVLQLKEEIEQYNQKIQNNKKNENNMSVEIVSNENKFRKIETQYREKMIVFEGERLKLVNLLKQKEKSISQSVTILREENEQLKKQLEKRQTQAKRQYDQYRQLVHKERIKQDQLEMQIDRLTNQLTRMTSLSERNKLLIDQLQSDIKHNKQTIKQLNIQKQGFQQLQIDNDDLKREIQNYKSREISITNTKDRQIKNLKFKIQELDGAVKEMEVMRSRVGIVMDEVYVIIVRIGGGTKLESIGDQYERIMNIRKELFYVESKILKQGEKINNYDKIQEEKQNMRLSIERFNIQRNQIKIRQIQSKRSEELLKRDIMLLKKNNQQLSKQISIINSTNNINSQKSIDNSVMYINEISHLKQIQQDYQVELKTNSQRYQSIISQIRMQYTQKTDKTRRQFITTIRRLETKIEELQHKIFTLEIQNQRLPQLSKKDEDIKRLTSKIFELEKQLVKANQEIIIKQVQHKPIVNKSDEIIKSKLEKQLFSLTNDHQRLNTKYKQLNNQLKQKQTEVQKLKLSLQSSKSQFSYEKSILQQQKSFSLQIQSKLRIEIDKLKSQIVMLKKLHEQNKSKLFNLESAGIQSYEIGIKTKQNQRKELERLNTQLNEEIFNVNQRNQQLKWELQQTIINKDNEIMSMQEELYSINSKENIRILKQSQYLERVKILDGEKRELEYLLEQSRSQVINQNESIKEMEYIINDQQSNINIAVENERKYEQILKSIRPELR